jgi:hypothetical protein
MAIARRPTMPHVMTAGTRAGSSGVGGPASDAALGVESLGDSTAVSEGSASLLDGESLGDSRFSDASSESFLEPALVLESLGDSTPSGESEGVLGEPEGLACGDGEEVCDDPLGLPLPPELPPLVGDGLEVGDGLVDPEPLDGLAVGEDVVGDWVGVGDGLVDVRVTGGATAGGTLPPAGRSCCQDHPTDPPAGTVSEPAPEDEYVHEACEPSAHHNPQKALAGEAFTHGSLVGTSLTRHTKPGWRVA